MTTTGIMDQRGKLHLGSPHIQTTRILVCCVLVDEDYVMLGIDLLTYMPPWHFSWNTRAHHDFVPQQGLLPLPDAAKVERLK